MDGHKGTVINSTKDEKANRGALIVYYKDVTPSNGH